MDQDATQTTTSSDLAGIRLYTPWTLLAYFVLGNLPIGMALYALNVARRGDRLFGYLLFAVSMVTFALLVLAAIAGPHFKGWTLLALLIGVGVFKMEQIPYRRAVQRGATAAPWWPPLLGVIALLVVLIVVAPAT
jgi:phosphoglycerol transferase MdoB-like AlkP superfamily enzyme